MPEKLYSIKESTMTAMADTVRQITGSSGPITGDEIGDYVVANLPNAGSGGSVETCTVILSNPYWMMAGPIHYISAQDNELEYGYIEMFEEEERQIIVPKYSLIVVEYLEASEHLFGVSGEVQQVPYIVINGYMSTSYCTLGLFLVTGDGTIIW